VTQHTTVQNEMSERGNVLAFLRGVLVYMYLRGKGGRNSTSALHVQCGALCLSSMYSSSTVCDVQYEYMQMPFPIECSTIVQKL
jgi:hypothetical protein